MVLRLATSVRGALAAAVRPSYVSRTGFRSTSNARSPSASSSEQTVNDWMKQLPTNRTKSHDTADLNKARQLALCLPDPSQSAGSNQIKLHSAEAVMKLAIGDTMPPGSELVFFNPLISEHVLGSDGTDRTLRPPGLDRRMWASGSFHFEQNNDIKIGDQLQCEQELETVKHRTGVRAGEMLLVTRKLTYSNEKGVATTERRCHAYQKPWSAEVVDGADSSKDTTAQENSKEEEKPSDLAWDYYATRATLFRYSAATFNAHRVHLDPEYCRNVEGHTDCLVHGPLTATLLLNLVANSNAGKVRSFEYRATSKLTVEQTIRLRGKWTQDDRRTAELWALNEAGTVCMTAKASLY